MPIIGNISSAGKKPSTPTIGTASDGGTGTTVSVAFTPSSYIGKGTITYTATSSPGSLTGTGSGSPITVSGLTTGTAYTFTVKGDTNYGVASDNSAASNSVTPASPSSFESIATFTGNNTTSTYTFSSIPTTYKSLQLRINGLANGGGSLRVRLNGDTASNYNWHKVVGTDSTIYAANSATNAMNMFGYLVSIGNSYPTVAIIDLIDYASTTKNKTLRAFSGLESNIPTQSEVDLTSGLWRNTSAVDSITVLCSANWESGSTICLYGIK